VLKTFSLIIAVFYTLSLAIVSLINLKEIPDIGVSNSDKIFHCLAYLVLTILWVNTFFLKYNVKKSTALIYSSVFSIVFGIVIEVLQESVTQVRSSDFYDALANTVGVLIAVIVLLINRKMYVKKI